MGAPVLINGSWYKPLYAERERLEFSPKKHRRLTASAAFNPLKAFDGSQGDADQAADDRTVVSP